MKHLIRTTLGLAALAAAISLRADAAPATPGSFDFGKLIAPASGGEFIEVRVNTSLIAMAARLAQKQEPEIAELIRGLHSIRVNVVELKDDNRAQVKKHIEALCKDLDTEGWDHVVTVQQQQENVNVYLKLRNEEAVEGLVVTVIEADRQAVLVNIVGDIKPEKVALIGERFNLEPLKKIGQKLEKH